MSESRTTTVLVVEDEVLLRFDLADTLSGRGYRVLMAANADEAITLLEADPTVGCVITDINMPGTMDGLALAHLVFNRWPPCRLILVSGNPTPLPETYPKGAHFLRKPMAEQQLAETFALLGL